MSLPPIKQSSEQLQRVADLLIQAFDLVKEAEGLIEPFEPGQATREAMDKMSPAWLGVYHARNAWLGLANRARAEEVKP